MKGFPTLYVVRGETRLRDSPDKTSCSRCLLACLVLLSLPLELLRISF